MKKWYLTDRQQLFSLGVLFGLTRVMNLSALPIFNDEAIYLDWGVRMWRYKEFFLSLYDGKPPLLMWIFGLATKVIPDPLIGGRLVSTGFGIMTVVGIWVLAKKMYGEKVAWWAGMIYCLTPLFLFFDRQALMESAMGMVGIWVLIATTRLINKPDFKNSILLVILWTAGVWIKANAILMVIGSLGVLTLTTQRKRKEVFGYWVFAVGLVLILLLPLVIQSGAGNIVMQNDRFSMTINELVGFPIRTWLVNLWSVIEIGWWQAGLLMWIPVGMWMVRAKKTLMEKRLIVWLTILLSAYVVLVKSPQPRYVLSFLPAIGVLMVGAINLKRRWMRISLGVSLAWMVLIDGLLIFWPIEYFRVLSKVTAYSQAKDYVSGFTSGYGVKPAIEYVVDQIGSREGLVGIRLDAGNPESSVSLYMSKHQNIEAVYFDERSVELPKVNYINSRLPMYYVARDENFAGVERFLIPMRFFYKPDGSCVGVYQVRTVGNN